MPKIHFTVEDLARTHLRTTLGPLTEAVFALGVLSHGGYAPYEKWRDQAIAQLSERTGTVRLLVTPQPKIRAPDGLLPLVDRARGTFDSALYQLNLSHQQVRVALLTLWRVAVAPYWNRIRGYLEADCEGRGRIAMARGVEGLLATLHPKITWKPPVLDVPSGSADDAGPVSLGGRGLQLTPSIFLVNRPGVLLGSAGDGQPALVFGSPPDPARAPALLEAPNDSSKPLSALIGQTRAAALRELTAPHTTRQLAERLGITPACASQHTAVLRHAGLITTRRLRNTALHTVTPLGLALLNGSGSTVGR